MGQAEFILSTKVRETTMLDCTPESLKVPVSAFLSARVSSPDLLEDLNNEHDRNHHSPNHLKCQQIP